MDYSLPKLFQSIKAVGTELSFLMIERIISFFLNPSSFLQMVGCLVFISVTRRDSLNNLPRFVSKHNWPILQKLKLNHFLQYFCLNSVFPMCYKNCQTNLIDFSFSVSCWKCWGIWRNDCWKVSLPLQIFLEMTQLKERFTHKLECWFPRDKISQR